LLTQKALKRGSYTSIAQLRAAILAYVDAHNERHAPFTWVKTADEILDNMPRFGLRVQQVHGQCAHINALDASAPLRWSVRHP
jgi:hypothetical protein